LNLYFKKLVIKKFCLISLLLVSLILIITIPTSYQLSQVTQHDNYNTIDKSNNFNISKFLNGFDNTSKINIFTTDTNFLKQNDGDKLASNDLGYILLAILGGGGGLAAIVGLIKNYFSERRIRIVSQIDKKLQKIEAMEPIYMQLATFFFGISYILEIIRSKYKEDSELESEHVILFIYYFINIMDLRNTLFETYGQYIKLDKIDAELILTYLLARIPTDVRNRLGYEKVGRILKLLYKRQHKIDLVDFIEQIKKDENKGIIAEVETYLIEILDTDLQEFTFTGKAFSQLITLELNRIFKDWYKEKRTINDLDINIREFLLKKYPESYERLKNNP
jgi:hypothetical protein